MSVTNIRRRGLALGCLFVGFGVIASGCNTTQHVFGSGNGGAGQGAAGGAGAAGTERAGAPSAGNSGGGSSGAGDAGESGDAAGATPGGAGGATGGSSGGGHAGSGGSSGGGGTSGGGSSGSGGTSGSGGASGAGCNNLTVSGPKLTLVSSSGSAPTMTYGTIKPGNYQLVKQTFYGSSVGFVPVVEVAHVTVSGQVATINAADSANVRSTIVVTMAQPASMPPASELMECSNDPFFSAYVKQDVKNALLYTATATSLLVYSVPGNDLLEFDLIP